jgi:hypothetical protein
MRDHQFNLGLAGRHIDQEGLILAGSEHAAEAEEEGPTASHRAWEDSLNAQEL